MKIQALTNEKNILEKQVSDLKKESLNTAVKDVKGDQTQVNKLKEFQATIDQLEQKKRDLKDQLEESKKDAQALEKEFEL